MNYLYGFILSLVIAGIAFYKKSLTIDGFLTSLALGTLIYAWGSYVAFSALIIFFISGSLLTKKEEGTKKVGRNYIQVICNALGATILLAFYQHTLNVVYLIAAVSSIAVSSSDTWASEIGRRTKGKTFSILNFKQVEKGLSGGVSILGFVASILGASLIGVSFLITMSIYDAHFNQIILYACVITFVGFMGAIVDSYLGVLIQAKYYNHVKQIIVESQNKLKEYQHISGLKIINNDAVNLIASVLMSVITVLVLI